MNNQKVVPPNNNNGPSANSGKTRDTEISPKVTSHDDGPEAISGGLRDDVSHGHGLATSTAQPNVENQVLGRDAEPGFVSGVLRDDLSSKQEATGIVKQNVKEAVINSDTGPGPVNGVVRETLPKEVSTNESKGHEETKSVLSNHGMVAAQTLLVQQFTMDTPPPSEPPSDNGWTSEAVTQSLAENNVMVQHIETPPDVAVAKELAEGHKLLLAVDGELAQDWGLEEDGLVVAGIDTTNPDNSQVLLQDPVSGRSWLMLISEFFAMISNNIQEMWATLETAPSWLPEMENFDFATGHLEQLGEWHYDVLVETPSETVIEEAVKGESESQESELQKEWTFDINFDDDNCLTFRVEEQDEDEA